MKCRRATRNTLNGRQTAAVSNGSPGSIRWHSCVRVELEDCCYKDLLIWSGIQFAGLCRFIRTPHSTTISQSRRRLVSCIAPLFSFIAYSDNIVGLTLSTTCGTRFSVLGQCWHSPFLVSGEIPVCNTSLDYASEEIAEMDILCSPSLSPIVILLLARPLMAMTI